jgi:hypothetical protein
MGVSLNGWGRLYVPTLFFLLFLLLALSLPATAHIYLTSYSYLTIDQNKITYQLKVPAAQFLQAIQIEADQLGENLEKATGYLRDKIKILSRGSPCNLELQKVHSLGEDPIFMLVDITFTCKKSVNNFIMICKILEDVPEVYHQNLAKLTFQGETRQFLFTPDRYYDWENGGGIGQIPQENLLIDLYEKIRTGIQQIGIGWYVPIFFLVLFLPVRALTETFKILIAFTLTQSLTFLWVPLLPWDLNPQFASAMAILGIVYMAMENLSVKTTTPRWVLAGAFGFVYGLYALLGIRNLKQETGLLFSAIHLFAFYTGLEIGQIFVLIFLVSVSYALNRWRFGFKIIQIVSVGILLIGLVQFFWEIFR